MKLNISFERDATSGREKAVITDDRGQRMPCVTAVTVHYHYDDPSTVDISLVVNRKDVTLGTATGGPVSHGRNYLLGEHGPEVLDARTARREGLDT